MFGTVADDEPRDDGDSDEAILKRLERTKALLEQLQRDGLPEGHLYPGYVADPRQPRFALASMGVSDATIAGVGTWPVASGAWIT